MRHYFLLLSLAGLLAACGTKGPLYLPTAPVASKAPPAAQPSIDDNKAAPAAAKP